MNVVTLVISLFVLLFAITVHEAAHGWAALKFGDDTAFRLGRISLNPIVHIDLIGTILIPLVLVIVGALPFGWAKPVPVNYFNLRHPRRDNLWISAAGPASNLTVAMLCLLAISLLKILSPGVAFFLRNFLLGRHVLPRGFYPLEGFSLILFYGVLVNVYLAVFNLIPIPPLDGSGVLMGLLSEEGARKYDRLRPFGFFIVLALVYLGVLQWIIRPVEIFILNVIFT